MTKIVGNTVQLLTKPDQGKLQKLEDWRQNQD